MVWSGITKSLYHIIYEQLKALEIPGLAILGPVVEPWLGARDPLEKGPPKLTIFKSRQMDFTRPVVAILQQDFVDLSGLNLSKHSEKAVTAYKKHESIQI